MAGKQNQLIKKKNLNKRSPQQAGASMASTTQQETSLGHDGTITMAGDEHNMKFTFWLKKKQHTGVKRYLVKSSPIASINLSRYFHVQALVNRVQKGAQQITVPMHLPNLSPLGDCVYVQGFSYRAAHHVHVDRSIHTHPLVLKAGLAWVHTVISAPLTERKF